MMILIILLVGAFIYYSMNGNTFKGAVGFSKRNPDELLKERFINGEIDEKTYVQMKETLRQ
ncbi:SHOCT domain-containing protein [Helicovermis profundi]|uniref:SHOCT domain-containing protein n=1 Tax=Helicovermis profundi TaxID=3065157 RepID=A0AAU9EAK4_9FIRM|nr:hypothetical protein HLPR_06550 [Clostridia bacterium S502]